MDTQTNISQRTETVLNPGLLPRLIRLRDAAVYLGMDKNRFNAEVRPQITEIPIGKQGIAFDRLELDAWVEHYKTRNGRPANLSGGSVWDANERRGSSNARASGISTNRSTGKEFAAVVASLNLKRPNAS